MAKNNKTWTTTMKKYTKIDGKRFEDICEQCKRNLYDCTCDEEKVETK